MALNASREIKLKAPEESLWRGPQKQMLGTGMEFF
jgi:hypothetical protein